MFGSAHAFQPRPTLRRRNSRQRFRSGCLEKLESRICPALPPGWTIDAGGTADMTPSALSATGSLISPTDGDYMLWMSTTGVTSTADYRNSLNERGTSGTIVRGPITSLVAGQTVSLDYYLSSFDYSPYNDFAVGLVSGSSLFSLTQTTAGNFASGWQHAKMVVPESGDYELVLVVSDQGDTAVETELYIDNLTGFDLPDLPGDPTPSVVTVAATTPTVSEGSSGAATFTVTRTGSLDSALTVEYYVYGTATAGTDYTALSGTVTFAVGAATATVDVAPLDDLVGEVDETVGLYLEYTSNGIYTVGYPSSAQVSIIDNDGGIALVGITASVTSVGEGDGTTSAFVLTRTGGNLNAPLTVAYYTYGSASPGTDYTALSGTATFAVGETTAAIDLTPIDDSTGELDETVSVYLSYVWNGNYSVDYQNWHAETEIVDNDGGIATVSIAASVTGVDEGARPTTAFTITRVGGNLNAPLTVYYYAYGSATSGTDYVALPGTITIPAGATSAAIDLAPIEDSIAEVNESVNVYLSYQWNGSYLIDWDNSDAATTILDNDGGISTVGVTSVAASIAEAAGTTEAFTVTRTGGNLNVPLTIEYYAYGSANPGVDYEPLSGEVTIPAGEASATIDLTPLDDDLGELDETVYVYLAYPYGGGYLIDYSNYGAEVAIDDDDGGLATVGLSTLISNIGEAAGTTAVFTVTRSGGNPNFPLTVEYYVYGDATPGTDYAPLSGEVTIPAGQSSATIDLSPIDDAVGEFNESVNVYLGYQWSGNYQVDWQNYAAETVIVDDDGGIAIVGISTLAASVGEAAASTPVFEVTRVGGNLSAPLTVEYYVYGDATSGTDYAALSGEVTIPAGQTSATIDLAPIDDLVGEMNESVNVYLTYQWNGDYEIDYQNSSAETAIVDNDGGIATVTMEVSAASVEEGESLTITVSREGGNLAAPLTVLLFDYAWDASPGVDYDLLPESVVIPAGQTGVNFMLSTIDDLEGEWDEEVVVYIDYPWGGEYIVGDPAGIDVFILDNDGGIPVVSIEATDANASEGGSNPGTFTITRTGGNQAQPLTVFFYVWGTADNGSDYGFIEESVTIPAGAASVTIQIAPVDDNLAEGTESVDIYLDWGYDYGIDWFNDEAEVLITDND